MAALKKHLIGFLILLCSGIHSYGQTDSLALSEEYYKMGMEVFDYTHRAQAKELFVLSTQMNPKSAKAQFMAGQSIMLTVNKENHFNTFAGLGNSTLMWMRTCCTI